ncbi:MAG TPA: nucleotidyltransferase family protein [Gammaproteobacteria bacterium]|nr:nucleotidyltransferase family protein [Gammaproteobacteria bacterium]
MVASAARQSLRLACVLLAAGGSRRLGRPKQLVRRRGQPLLVHATRAARGALPGAPLVVVLGAQALRLRALLRRRDPAARAVLNSRWSTGLASSLARGLRALPSDIDAALVLLVDHPDVDAAALRRLIAAWRRRPAAPAAAGYLERAGVPAILPRRSWRALRDLEGDSGARALLRGGGATLVDMPEAALDVDTPEDAARLSPSARTR